MAVYPIIEDNYYKKDQPAKSEELINTVNVLNSPLIVEDYNDEIYKTPIAFVLNLGERKTVVIEYTDIPVLNSVVTAYKTDSEGEIFYDETTGNISNVVVSGVIVDYYAHGASVFFDGTNDENLYVVIVAAGFPLKSRKDVVTKIYESGIVENGVLNHDLKKNHLLQDRNLCETIGNTLLNVFQMPRKDIKINWRGNLDLDIHVNNTFSIPEYNKNGILTIGEFKIFKQVTKFDGAFEQNTDGRKI